MPQEPVIIPISKGKLVKLICFCFLFLFIGTWMLFTKHETGNSVMDSALVKYGAAVLGILMGATGLVFFIRKLGDKKPGLIIDDNGITDNASGVAAGFIPWEDITHIYTTKVMNQEFIMIGVTNPEGYISRQPGALKRKMMKANMKSYGSPISSL
jgi:hypothetical protein